jgi:hypothetical protein
VDSRSGMFWCGSGMFMVDLVGVRLWSTTQQGTTMLSAVLAFSGSNKINI